MTKDGANFLFIFCFICALSRLFSSFHLFSFLFSRHEYFVFTIEVYLYRHFFFVLPFVFSFFAIIFHLSWLLNYYSLHNVQVKTSCMFMVEFFLRIPRNFFFCTYTHDFGLLAHFSHPYSPKFRLYRILSLST